MREETGNLQQYRAGDYLIGCAVEHAEGLYRWESGRLQWTTATGENAYIEVVVCHAPTVGSWPALDVSVQVQSLEWPDGW